MDKLTVQQIQRGVQLARRSAEQGGEQGELARLLLALNDRLEQAQHLLRETEHYLTSGQEASSHAHLLRNINHYQRQSQPQADSVMDAFGLE